MSGCGSAWRRSTSCTYLRRASKRSARWLVPSVATVTTPMAYAKSSSEAAISTCEEGCRDAGMQGCREAVRQ
eukprot:scaffold132538_cov69-Phaeocystis_antarctica.AAC.6